MTVVAAPQVDRSTGLLPREPFSPQRTQEILEQFRRDGFYLIRNVLSPEEVQAFKDGIDRVFASPTLKLRENLYNDFVLVRLFETETIFRDLLVREPIISIVEAALGKTCHLMAHNAVRNERGKAIDQFHIDADSDCGLEFPCPPELPRHDARYRIPILRMTVQLALTDIDTIDHGPSQYVRGSHYSGRIPNDLRNPSFEGEGPTSILCKAGDIYLHHGMCWHRGAPNNSDRVRYLMQLAYSQRWIAQRFYPFLNYKMPDHVLEGADERLLRVLGKHPKGPYG